jgi:hypothetical protein
VKKQEVRLGRKEEIDESMRDYLRNQTIRFERSPEVMLFAP